MVRARGKTAMRRVQAAAEKAGFHVIKPAIPEGMEPVEGSNAAGFFTFEAAGQEIVGVLTATTPIENTSRGVVEQRYVFVRDGDTDPVILPSHYDLMTRLDKLATRMPIRVWIQYLGQQEANVPSGFLHRYAVATVKATQQPLKFPADVSS
jgi:hypothetical protein